MADKQRLFDEKTQRKLQQITLMASRVRAGAIKGERRSKKRGTSIEFADYRNYTQGDDLRRLDWNIYARTERPYIKLLEDEEDLAVHLIIDVSASMDYPEDPEHNKLMYAQRLIAALAYVSLTSNDRTTITAVSSSGQRFFGPARGRAQGVPMMNFVADLQAKGITDLNPVLKDYALRSKRPGLCLIATDMFSPGGYVEGLNVLLGKGYEVGVLHILAPEEISPPLAGDLRLIDMESGEVQEVTIDSDMRALYERRLAAWREDIRAECARKGVHYVSVETSTPWERLILYELRRLGIVR